jgi:hypothetical protein
LGRDKEIVGDIETSAGTKEAPDQCGWPKADHCCHEKTVGEIQRKESNGGEVRLLRRGKRVALRADGNDLGESIGRLNPE